MKAEPLTNPARGLELNLRRYDVDLAPTAGMGPRLFRSCFLYPSHCDVVVGFS